MKKISIMLIVSLFLACPFFEEPTPTRAPLSPPQWIQGTWSDAYGINNYTFTSDDVIYLSDVSGDYENIDYSYKDLNSQLPRTQGFFDSRPNETTYEIEVILDGQENTIYTFVLTSPTTLDFTLDYPSTPSETTIELLLQ